METITAKTPWKDYLGDLPLHLEYFEGTMFGDQLTHIGVAAAACAQQSCSQGNIFNFGDTNLTQSETLLLL